MYSRYPFAVRNLYLYHIASDKKYQGRKMKKLLTNQLQVDAPFTYVTNLEQVGENTYYGTSFFGDLAVNGHTAACLCSALYLDLSGIAAFSLHCWNFDFSACVCGNAFCGCAVCIWLSDRQYGHWTGIYRRFYAFGGERCSAAVSPQSHDRWIFA